MVYQESRCCSSMESVYKKSHLTPPWKFYEGKGEEKDSKIGFQFEIFTYNKFSRLFTFTLPFPAILLLHFKIPVHIPYPNPPTPLPHQKKYTVFT